MKFGCSIGIFHNTAHLICRSTDISKCFRGSLRLRDNESRLYTQDVIQCIRSSNCIDNLVIIYIFLKRNSFCKRHYAGTFDVSCGMFNDVISLYSRHSDTDSENVSLHMIRLSVRWPENMQFKWGIIDRYIIKYHSMGLSPRTRVTSSYTLACASSYLAKA